MTLFSLHEGLLERQIHFNACRKNTDHSQCSGERHDLLLFCSHIVPHVAFKRRHIWLLSATYTNIQNRSKINKHVQVDYYKRNWAVYRICSHKLPEECWWRCGSEGETCFSEHHWHLISNWNCSKRLIYCTLVLCHMLCMFCLCRMSVINPLGNMTASYRTVANSSRSSHCHSHTAINYRHTSSVPNNSI